MIVLDAHAWLWWMAGDERLSANGKAAIERASSAGIPAICCWELALLEARGKISLAMGALEWMEAALALPRARLLPLSPRVATLANTACEVLHRDPVDRIVVATALDLGVPVVSADERIRKSGVVEAVW